MKYVTCNVCKGVWRIADDAKLPGCPKKGCSGSIKVTANASLFSKAQDLVAAPAAGASAAAAPAILISTATLPKKATDVTQAYAKALFDALVKESAGALPKSSEVTMLTGLAAGTAADMRSLGVVTTMAKAFITREAQRKGRRDAMTNLKAQSATLKGGTEEFYRLTMSGEAAAITSGKPFAQSDSSMDKYKWFYQGNHHPLDGGGRTHRLTMIVPKGTLKLILDMAVPHEGPGLQAAIVSRDVAMFQARTTNAIDGTILGRMTNEPGSFAVHEDVLDILSSMVVRASAAPL
jgi:hypothetical protein